MVILTGILSSLFQAALVDVDAIEAYLRRDIIVPIHSGWAGVMEICAHMDIGGGSWRRRVPRGNPRINRAGRQYPKGKFITSCPARVGFEKTISPPLMACLPP